MLNIYDADGLLVSRWYDIVDEMRAFVVFHNLLDHISTCRRLALLGCENHMIGQQLERGLQWWPTSKGDENGK